MGIDELCTLPVADLAAPDSVLFLWATFPQLPEALRLIKAWGFTYKSVAFVWLKKNRKSEGCFMPGLLDAGQRGNLPAGDKGTPEAAGGKRPSIHYFPYPGAQPKAEEARDKIVALMGDVPRWSCSQGSPRPAGTYGGTRWKAPSRTSGQSVQRWPGRKGVTKNSLCKCPQRLIQNQDQTCL